MSNTHANHEPIPYLNARAAAWVINAVAGGSRFDRPAVSALFWLTGGDPDRWQALLDALLTTEEQERIGPDLRRAWGDHDETGGDVWSMMARSLPGRTTRALDVVLPLVEAWRQDGLRDADAPLARHLESTRHLFGLTADETELCFFLAAMAWYEPLRSYFDHHLDCDRPHGLLNLARALGWSADRLGRAMGGKVRRIGILDLQRTVAVESEFVPFFVETPYVPTMEDLFRTPPAADLGADALALPAEALTVVRACLDADVAGPCHILLYGPPGTGKTTLARALVAELGLEGLEVMGVRDNLNRARRASLAVCLEMASSRPRSVVLVDEADRVLSTVGAWSALGEAADKGWLTRMLDESPVRTIWIVNDRDAIDEAVRRRFAMSLELRKPGARQRALIVKDVAARAGLGPWPDDATAKALAEEFDLAPALFATAAATTARVVAQGGDIAATFRQALKAKRDLMDLPAFAGARPTPGGFLDDGVNPERGLDALVRRVQAYDALWRRGEADLPPLAMLFHGAPGTGKSETARHLARLMDRPVVMRRASDLLGMFVGQTEKAIAEAFAEAAAEGAVLVLDEVDSLLQSRGRAQRNWEVSMVNEMLVQIEHHRGMVVVTTNRRDDLDAAALRRFSVKTEFRTLTPQQVQAVYEHLLAPLTAVPLPPATAGRLRRLAGVTASDCALVRRNRMLLADETVSHEALVDELEQEIAARTERRTACVGFAVADAPATRLERKEAACL